MDNTSINHSSPLKFEQVPEAISEIKITVNELKHLLEHFTRETQPEKDELLTVKGAAEFLQLSIPTIYGLISRGELPVMKRSKRCYFSRLELMSYLREGRKKTLSEIQAEADKYTDRKIKRR